jgi:hypothetical protein
MESVRVYEIPPCKMVSSGCGMFGDGVLERFDAWFSSLPRPLTPHDFLWADESRGGLIWYYIYEEGMRVPEEFELVDFPGGLYAVATGIDGRDSSDVMAAIQEFLLTHPCFEEDFSRTYLGNIPTPPIASAMMGYAQMDYYVPIKLSGNK